MKPASDWIHDWLNSCPGGPGHYAGSNAGVSTCSTCIVEFVHAVQRDALNTVRSICVDRHAHWVSRYKSAELPDGRIRVNNELTQPQGWYSRSYEARALENIIEELLLHGHVPPKLVGEDSVTPRQVVSRHRTMDLEE